jgi:hypothetical protein
MERNVHIGNKWWKIMTIYSRKEDNKKTCRRRNERKQGRLYTLGRRLELENRRKRDGKRKSKEKVENAEGKRLMEWIEGNGWEVLNRNKQGNEEGELTNIGIRGETVID